MIQGLLLLLHSLRYEPHGVMIDAIDAVDKFNKALQRSAVCARANILLHELLLQVCVGVQRSLEGKLRGK